VPLVDAAGTVIALVNPASVRSPAETVTYDPSGNPSSTSQGNSFPFLYQGMEHEFIEPSQYDYSGNGALYSAQLMRGLSMVGAQGTSGPGETDDADLGLWCGPTTVNLKIKDRKVGNFKYDEVLARPRTELDRLIAERSSASAAN
jgi:hypothetical protein